MKIKPYIWLVGLVASAIVMLSRSADAVPIIYTLDNWNVIELNGSGDTVMVTADTDGNGNTMLSVQWVSGDGSDPNAIGVDMFGFNSTTSILTCPSDWNCNLGSQTMDGFGSFTQFEKEPSGDGGISSPIVFVLNGTASFTSNDHSSTFAAHVRYSNDCSGFVSDGDTNSIKSDSNCASVPEPSSLLLLGSGLAGLGLWRRMRKD